MEFNKSAAKTKQRANKWGAAVLLGVMLSTCLVSAGQAADLAKGRQGTRVVYLVKAGSGANVRFTKNPGKNLVRMSTVRYEQSNPYVCTPSGFGQKARCYARGI